MEYNKFRKQIFSELAPKESEDILYLLPWLLSINHYKCPGYIPNLSKPFRVFNVDNERDVRRRERVFKRRFGVKKRGSLLRPPSKYCLIHGLYTIGSVGTVTQTSSSDCDIWVCYDKREFDESAWCQLKQKINLIKDWMDMHVKIPVFFFICDVSDIRNSRFGRIDSEGSGSIQKNVLKEEFYRTCIVICGKIPLWWICYDRNVEADYEEAVSLIDKGIYGDYDIIDFGNLAKVERSEYLGASLWQLHKSLSRPLKSIIKMVLLKMILDTPYETLISHRFREQILYEENHDVFSDPSVFTMSAIFNHYNAGSSKETLTLLKECFYLRCQIKPYDRKQACKKKLINDLYRQYPISWRRKIRLGRFVSWDFNSQVEFGNSLSSFLLDIYKEIAATHTRYANEIDEQDLTILGRKISACYQNKKNKISVLQKPTGMLNLSNLVLKLKGDVWHVFSGNDKSRSLVSNTDIVYNVAFMVWNGLFNPNSIRMKPNPSSVTLQEIINLGKKLRDFIGTYDVSDIDFVNFLKKDHITKLLVIISFEKSPWEKDINDFSLVYNNSWGELFVERFNSLHKLGAFLRNSSMKQWNIETGYYLQRNSTYYEKIIKRTRKALLPVI